MWEILLKDTVNGKIELLNVINKIKDEKKYYLK